MTHKKREHPAQPHPYGQWVCRVCGRVGGKRNHNGFHLRYAPPPRPYDDVVWGEVVLMGEVMRFCGRLVGYGRGPAGGETKQDGFRLRHAPPPRPYDDVALWRVNNG